MVALVRQCLDAHGGEFDPSWISHKKMGLHPDEERVYSTFNKLLMHGGMKAFIESHPEFSWRPKGQTGMIITWAHGQVAQEAPQIAGGVVAPGSASASGGGASSEQVAVAVPSSHPQAPATGAASASGGGAGHSEAPAATATGTSHSEALAAPGSASAFGAVGGEDSGSNSTVQDKVWESLD